MPGVNQNLTQLLTHDDPNTRLDAVIALGVQAAGTNAVPALVDRAGVEEDFTVREALTWALVQHAEASLPLVAHKLNDDDPVVRRQAAHVLSKIGGPDVAPHIASVVADTNDEVAVKGFRAASNSGDASVIPALVSRLGQGDQELQDALVNAFARLGEPAVPALGEALRSEDAAVRSQAADALGHIGSPDADPALPALVALLGDEDDDVRLTAISSIGQLDAEVRTDAVKQALTNPDGRVAAVARRLGE